MPTHTQILTALQQQFPADPLHPERFGVALVAQYAEPALALPGGRAHIFIPDCHLLTPPDMAAYPNNHFQLDNDLLTLLTGLRDFKNAHRGDVLIWHMGDLFDAWRARGGRGDRAEIDAIAAAYANHLQLLLTSPPTGMRARLLAGNHDYVTHELTEWGALRVGIIENQDPAGADILVVHGDLFDWIERFPDNLQAKVVRAARQVGSGQTTLNQQELREGREMVAFVNQGLGFGDTPIGFAQGALSATRPQIALGPPWAVNLVDVGPAASKENVKFFDEAAKLAVKLKENGYDIRAVVIGHTHHARMVRGNRDDGVPFVLMDCGAWMGQCRFADPDPWIWSAQLGVLAEAELRIYQLGFREAV
jgi:UDP-2,3-diacylglucosamine pyrophosphatase LpxH